MKPKHVIFLGAGASATSGYPMANRLTLLMSDRLTLIQEILQCLRDSGEQWAKGWFHNSAITRYLTPLTRRRFRYVTVHLPRSMSFSRLSVGGEHASNIRMLKKLMCDIFLRFIILTLIAYQKLITPESPIQALLGHSSRIREDICDSLLQL